MDQNKKQQLKSLAVDICENKVFGQWQIEGNYASIVFLPLLFFKEEDTQKLKDKYPNGCICYEYIEKAGPRTINGMPIFQSVCFLNMDDVPYVNKQIQKYTRMKNEFITCKSSF